MAKLSFDTLHVANVLRNRLWNGREAGHTWPMPMRLLKLNEEVGELYAAYMGEQYPPHALPNKDTFEDELADVVIMCSLIAEARGCDLAACIIAKFNKTSARHSSRVTLQDGNIVNVQTEETPNAN